MGWRQVLESQRRALEILQWPEKWQRWAMVAVSYRDDRKTKELAKTHGWASHCLHTTLR